MNHLLEFENTNPNTWRAEEALQAAVIDAQRAGLPAERAVAVVMRLVQAGKQIASGGNWLDTLESVRAIILHEVAAATITSSQAESVLRRVDSIQSILEE